MTEQPTLSPAEEARERRMRRIEAHQRMQLLGLLASLLLVYAILRDPNLRELLTRRTAPPSAAPAPTDARVPLPEGDVAIELGDGRVVYSLEEAAEWVKRMAGKLGEARLRMHDIHVVMHSDDRDWVLSVSTLESDGPTRLATAARLWLVLLFTAPDMAGVVPQPDTAATRDGRIGMMFVVPREPRSLQRESY